MSDTFDGMATAFYMSRKGRRDDTGTTGKRDGIHEAVTDTVWIGMGMIIIRGTVFLGRHHGW